MVAESEKATKEFVESNLRFRLRKIASGVWKLCKPLDQSFHFDFVFCPVVAT